MLELDKNVQILHLTARTAADALLAARSTACMRTAAASWMSTRQAVSDRARASGEKA
jgi:hypothetical protein